MRQAPPALLERAFPLAPDLARISLAQHAREMRQPFSAAGVKITGQSGQRLAPELQLVGRHDQRRQPGALKPLPRSPSCRSRSAFFGTTISAAAVGVLA